MRDDANEEVSFTLMIYEMDVERVRYSLARYLRARILKIERSLEYILSNIDIMDRLSVTEKQFASKLDRLNSNYFEETVAKRFQSADARTYYEGSENRLKNALPSDNVSCCCMQMIVDVGAGDAKSKFANNQLLQ